MDEHQTDTTPDPVPKEWLQAALAARDVTQAELARRVSVDSKTVWAWHSGHASIRPVVWFGVLAALDLPRGWTPLKEIGR